MSVEGEKRLHQTFDLFHFTASPSAPETPQIKLRKLDIAIKHTVKGEEPRYTRGDVTELLWESHRQTRHLSTTVQVSAVIYLYSQSVD